MKDEVPDGSQVALASHLRWKAPSWRRLVAGSLAYVAGTLATGLIVWAFVLGEASAAEFLPYLLAFNLLFGLIVGGIWLLALPPVYYLLILPVFSIGESNVHYTYDRTEHLLKSMIAIGVGMGVHWLVAQITEPRR